MKVSASTILFISAFSLCLTQSSLAQVAPSSGKAPSTVEPTTWSIFAGGSFERGASQNFYGWNMSVSEYPYPAVPWLGGTIEGSGAYNTQSGVSTGLYRVMGGPSISARKSRVQPFAHVLFGGVVEKASVTVLGVSASTSANTLAVAAGGGVDFPINSTVAIRTQGDWVRDGKSNSINFFRGAAGVVFRF